jgi:hypothetical protein
VNLQKSGRLIRIEQRFKSSVDSDDLRWFTRDMSHKGIRARRVVRIREFLDRKGDFVFQILTRPPLLLVKQRDAVCVEKWAASPFAKGTRVEHISRAQDFL